MTMAWIVAGSVLSAMSGLPGLLMKKGAVPGQRIATAMMVSGAIFVAIGIFPVMTGGKIFNGLYIGVDALSAFFLFPVFLMGCLGSVYGLGYWSAQKNAKNSRKIQLFWGFLTAGMSLLVIARSGFTFILGWEAMAMSAFFLISTEDELEETREAAWIYIIATHIGTLALFGLFAFWNRATGSLLLRPLSREELSLAGANTIFFLALLGFGMKAGVIPFHFWLPAAHANAPTHVSAMLSGVVLKMGIYGFVRFLSLVPDPPPAWGGIILSLGMVSGLLGVVFAIAQHDLKRLLAYHSVENIGIILMGLGLAMIGRSAHRPGWIVLGMAGCLLHVWNHSLFKGLLFLSAGSVIHGTETKRIDLMGGLAKKMPWTAAFFLTGAVAICGLPPLNGFVSELFVYLGLLNTTVGAGAPGSAAIIAVPVLAMVGALAVACFVKVYGTVFSGIPRSLVSAHAHESPLSMRIPMVVLAVLCLFIGLFPVVLVAVLNNAIAAWSLRSVDGNPDIGVLVPLKTISGAALLLFAFAAVFGIPLFLRYRQRRQPLTWDCGYAQPTSRMQYTASSLAHSIVDFFAWVLRTRKHEPVIEGPFPHQAALSSHADELVLDRALLPMAYRMVRTFALLRRFQHGFTHFYLLYILIIVVVMLGTLIPFKDVLMRFFIR